MGNAAAVVHRVLGHGVPVAEALRIVAVHTQDLVAAAGGTVLVVVGHTEVAGNQTDTENAQAVLVVAPETSPVEVHSDDTAAVRKPGDHLEEY